MSSLEEKLQILIREEAGITEMLWDLQSLCGKDFTYERLKELLSERDDIRFYQNDDAHVEYVSIDEAFAAPHTTFVIRRD